LLISIDIPDACLSVGLIGQSDLMPRLLSYSGVMVTHSNSEKTMVAMLPIQSLIQRCLHSVKHVTSFPVQMLRLK